MYLPFFLESVDKWDLSLNFFNQLNKEKSMREYFFHEFSINELKNTM